MQSKNYLEQVTLSQNRILRNRKVIQFVLLALFAFFAAGLAAQTFYWFSLPDLSGHENNAAYEKAQKVNAALTAAKKQYDFVQGQHIPISAILTAIDSAKTGTQLTITKIAMDAKAIRIEGTANAVSEIHPLIDRLKMAGYPARLERVSTEKGLQMFQIAAGRVAQ